jgi:hypothetical protein
MGSSLGINSSKDAINSFFVELNNIQKITRFFIVFERPNRPM